VELPSTILYEKKGRVAIVTFNRPEARNAFTLEMLEGMNAAFDDFNNDPDLWVAILTGVGEKSFCAGMDLRVGIPRLTSGEKMGKPDNTKRPFSDIFKPIICAVNGYCIAGGMEFLQGTDLRIAAEHATFGLGEVRWGIIPMGGSHIRLPRQIPWALAMEVLLTGQPIDAKRAYEIGLINKVVPADELMTAALELAEKICQNGPLAVRTAKEIVVRSFALENGFVLETSMGAGVLASEDAQEGPRAFAEKRQPRFTGR